MTTDFTPEYPGDNPNRKWVRDKAREEGLEWQVRMGAIKRLPPALLRAEFDWIMSPQFPEGLANAYPL